MPAACFNFIGSGQDNLDDGAAEAEREDAVSELRAPQPASEGAARCPTGHLLMKQELHLPLGCNRCGAHIGPGTNFYGCRLCNYDLCPDCYASTASISIVPRVLGKHEDDSSTYTPSSRSESGSSMRSGRVKKSRKYRKKPIGPPPQDFHVLKEVIVRAGRCETAAMLGQRRRGDIVQGVQDGAWVRLAEEPGAPTGFVKLEQQGQVVVVPLESLDEQSAMSSEKPSADGSAPRPQPLADVLRGLTATETAANSSLVATMDDSGRDAATLPRVWIAAVLVCGWSFPVCYTAAGGVAQACGELATWLRAWPWVVTVLPPTMQTCIVLASGARLAENPRTLHCFHLVSGLVVLGCLLFGWGKHKEYSDPGRHPLGCAAKPEDAPLNVVWIVLFLFSIFLALAVVLSLLLGCAVVIIAGKGDAGQRYRERDLERAPATGFT